MKGSRQEKLKFFDNYRGCAEFCLDHECISMHYVNDQI